MNRVILKGRLTRDPETRTFGNTKVVQFGLAINERKKNQQTGQYEDAPLFIDCKAFAKTAETVERFFTKGREMLLEGKLNMEKWTDKASGQERSKMSIVVDSVFFCGDKPQGGGSSQQQRREPAARQPDFDDEPQHSGGEEIPF